MPVNILRKFSYGWVAPVRLLPYSLENDIVEIPGKAATQAIGPFPAQAGDLLRGGCAGICRICEKDCGAGLFRRRLADGAKYFFPIPIPEPVGAAATQEFIKDDSQGIDIR